MGVLLISAGLAIFASSNQLTLLLGLTAGIIGLLALERWPQIGLIAAPVVGMVIPFRGPSGLNASSGKGISSSCCPGLSSH